MLDLRSGMKVMHNCHAVELLFMTDHDQNGEIWRVKLLFVEPKEVNELFEKNDRVSFIHSKGATQ